MAIPQRVLQLAQLTSSAYVREAQQLKRGDAPSSTKSYERALARLGMTILSEQSAELMPYLRGFQLIDKSDEGDFAAGFFIFDINGTVVDAPIFLIDGKIKGFQIIFLREQGVFLPSQPEVIQYIMSHQDQTMGVASYGNQEHRPNKVSPNFDMYSGQNRYLTKAASYPSHFDSWSRASGALESFSSICHDPATHRVVDAARKTGRLPSRDIVSLLQHRKCAAMLKRWCDKSPRLSRKVAALLGPAWRQGVDSYFAAREDYVSRKAASIRLGGTLRLSGGHTRRAKVAALGSLEHVGDVPNREAMVDEFMRVGAVFFDERPGSLKRAMLVQDENESWSSPLESGHYTVPMLSGDTRKLHVTVPKNIIAMGHGLSRSLLVDFEEKSVLRCESRDVAVSGEEETQTLSSTRDQDDCVSKLPRFTGGEYGEDEVLIIYDCCGYATEPLRVVGRGTDDTYELRSAYVPSVGSASPVGDMVYSSDGDSPRPRCAVVRGEEGRRMRVESIGGEGLLVLPPDARVLRVACEPDDTDGYSGDVKSFRILPLSEMKFERLSKEASFDIRHSVADIVELNGRSMRRRDAVAVLMHNGVRKQAAIEVVCGAEPLRRQFAIVDERGGFSPWQLASNRKIAVGRQQMQYDPDFQFAEPSSGNDGESQGWFPMPQETGVSERIRSTGMELADKGSAPWSSEQTPYGEARVSGGGSDGSQGGDRDAERLARDGDAIFENTLFVSLAGHVDPATDRERLISGLMRACDDAGRSLFLNYAHGEEFAEAYGVTDASELEEQLLRVLEASGQLMIMLRNRSIEDTNDLSLASLTDS